MAKKLQLGSEFRKIVKNSVASIMTAELSSNLTLSTTDYETLTLSSSMKLGNDLSISNGGIKVAKQGYVKVSGKLSFNSCSAGLKWLTLYRENTAVCAMPFNTSTARITLSIPPIVIAVNANQTIYMKALGASGDVIRSASAYTEMTVEYVYES